MKLRAYFLAGALALPCLAFAVDDGQLVSTVKTVERGYARAMGTLNAAGEQPSALTMTNPFVTSPFAPRASAAVSWALTGVDADQTILCVTKTVSNVNDWGLAVKGLSQAGLYSANPSTCEAVASFVPPPAFPAQLGGIKLLDRRAVPTPTLLPTDPVISGVDGAAVTRPGMELRSADAPGYRDITVFNPATVTGVDPGPPAQVLYRSLSLSAASVRPGFSVSHDCDNVGPDAFCTVRVSYDAGAGDRYPGNLRMVFSNGAVAVISLLGRTNGISLTAPVVVTSSGGTTATGTAAPGSGKITPPQAAPTDQSGWPFPKLNYHATPKGRG